ncbi:MAG: Glu-tRNA(Gln) amidotransferase GatDE subunit E, partial [Candidatus Bathyarchaeia archaeon]
ETRAASLDGTTHFSRPRPGAARMYPETDIPPFVVSKERLMRIKSTLPPLPEIKLRRLVETYHLSEKLALQVMNSDYLDLFENLANCTNIPPTFIAATLTETFKSLHREGLNIQAVTEEDLYHVFKAVDNGVMAKEAIVDVVKWLATNPSKTFDDAITSLHLSLLPEDKVIEYVDRLVNENEDLITARGFGAIGPLMGEVMRSFRGRVDAKFVSTVLRRKIEDKLNQIQRVS